MDIKSKTNRSECSSASGYTLVEMVLVIVIVGLVGMVSSFVVLESMRVYARVAPHVDASYQARQASERIQRDVRALSGTASITAFTDTEFAFEVSSGSRVSYSYTGTALTRNGSPLAKGVSSCEFRYLTGTGAPAVATSDLRLVDVRFAVKSADGDLPIAMVVFPRGLN